MMCISLTGLLERTAKILDQGGDTGRAFDLRTLLKNLKELEQRKTEGEKVIEEFFALYKTG